MPNYGRRIGLPAPPTKVANVGNGIDQAVKIGTGAQILVTGSLYLVEAALEIAKNESI